MNADGSGVRQLTFVKEQDGADLRQQWSPDGTKLVFEHRNMSRLASPDLGDER